MVFIGDRLKEERDRLGLTQEQMAGRLGVTQKTQGLYDRSQREPKSDYLDAMVALGGDVLYVLTGERTNEYGTSEMQEAAGPYSKTKAQVLSYKEIAVLKYMWQLSSEHQEMLKNIAESMLKTQNDQQIVKDFVSGGDQKEQGDNWWPDQPKEKE